MGIRDRLFGADGDGANRATRADATDDRVGRGPGRGGRRSLADRVRAGGELEGCPSCDGGPVKPVGRARSHVGGDTVRKRCSNCGDTFDVDRRRGG